MMLFVQSSRAEAKVTPPVIITGMHRSGTSLLSRLMEEAGLFVGAKKESNNEALFFQNMNICLLELAGARWDVPEPFEWLLESDECVEDIVRRLRAAVLDQSRWSAFARSFGTPQRLRRPWGWKDPRNTLTLPLWLRVFPDARVLEIRRHGVDVAASLCNRSSQWFRTGLLGSSLSVHRWQGSSVRCTSLGRALTLWSHYLERSASLAAAEPTRVFRLTFEELVADPHSVIRDAAAHCGLADCQSRQSPGIQAVRSRRALAFRAEPALCAFARANAPILEKHGYGV